MHKRSDGLNLQYAASSKGSSLIGGWGGPPWRAPHTSLVVRGRGRGGGGGGGGGGGRESGAIMHGESQDLHGDNAQRADNA